MLFSKHSEIPGRHELWGQGRGQTQFSPMLVGQPSRAGFVALMNSSLSAQSGEHITGPPGAWWGPLMRVVLREGSQEFSSLEASFLSTPTLCKANRSHVPFLPFSMWLSLSASYPALPPSSSWLPTSGWTHSRMCVCACVCVCVCVCVLAGGELPLFGASVLGTSSSLIHPSISLLCALRGQSHSCPCRNSSWILSP